MERTNQMQQEDKEFSRCAVPFSGRKTYFSLTIVWTGFVFVITSMMAGGGLAAGMDFKNIILATIGGNVFLSIIAVLISVIACRTGLTFALLTRYSFGSNGSKVASLFVPVVNLGWYTIQAATYGHFVAQVFHMGDVGEGICMAASAVVMGIFAMCGIQAITILGYIAIPAIVFLSVATAIRSLGVIGGIQALMSYQPPANMPLFTGITAVIGTWVLSTATCIADIMRYAKDTKTAISATLTGLLGGNILMIICGAVAAIAMENSDLTVILLSFGLVIPSLILMTTNIFTTNAANLYSTSLNLSNAFKMERKKMLSILLVVSALATLTKPYEIDVLFTFLNVLGTVVPPLSGIILADYFLVHKGEYSSYAHTEFAKWNPVPWITWAICIGIVYLIPFGLPSLNGIILGAILYTGFMSVSKKKVAWLK